MNHPPIELTETTCRSLLQKSAMEFTDYHVNPYVGCAFGCSFCYVPLLRKFRGQEWETWGQWAQVKRNAVEVLRREMAKIGPEARITIGSASDAWQPVEKRFGVTRAILEELTRHSNPISIITRSPLLLRDIPLLQALRDRGGVHVGLSLSTFDEQARRVFEPFAPRVAGREHLARRLLAAEIPFSLFWMPLLPGVSDNAAGVTDYLSRAKALGAPRVVCDLLNYRETMGARYTERLSRYYAACAAATGTPNQGRPGLGRVALAREIQRQSATVGVACHVCFAV